MATASSYKPSPLGQFGSPRSSPFRRPESPASPSPLRQQTTPLSSPLKSSSRPPADSYPESTMSSTPTAAQPRTPRGTTTPLRPSSTTTPRAIPFDTTTTTTQSSTSNSNSNSNALSQLQPTQVRILREGFELLDRDGDGTVTRDDISDMLAQLGLPSSASDVSRYFFPPPSTTTASPQQTLTLAAFLNSLAPTLASLSPPAELLSALSAFDDDDSGQIDLAELRDAVLNTAPEPGERALTPAEVDVVLAGFTGRRAFKKSNVAGGGGHGLGAGGKRGEVFRYQEFVNSIAGNGGGNERGEDGEQGA